MTPTNKAIREALRGARTELWDTWHSGMSEEHFNADPTIQDIDNAIALLDAEAAGVGGDGTPREIWVDHTAEAFTDDPRISQGLTHYIRADLVTAPAEPEAEGDVEEKPHTTLGDIIEFVSENAADLVNKKVCPSDSRDKDLIAVRDALELQSFEIRPQLGLPIVVEGGGRFIHERDFISAKSKILAIVNRMIAQTDKTGVV